MSKSDVIQGLNYPNIKPSLNKIIDIVKNNIIKNYRNNENFLRNYFYDNNPIEEYKNKFLKEIKILDNYTNDVIHKEKNLLDIINENNGKKDFYYKIINDYYTIFISNIINKNKKEKNLISIFTYDNIDVNKKILEMIFNLRFKNFNDDNSDNDNDSDIIIKMAKTINWVESYSKEIFLLLKIFMKLYQKNSCIYQLIEDMVYTENIKYDNNERYIPIINEGFFVFINKILRIICTEEKLYELSESDILDILKINNEILVDTLQLENDLNLYSEEVITLNEIIKITEIFHKHEIINAENIKKIIKYFSIKIKCYNDSKKLCDNFNEFFNFFDEKLKKNEKNDKNLDKLGILSYFFLNEFQRINNDDLKELILEKILKNNDLIKYSSEVLKIILENKINIDPENFENMISNIDNLKKEKSKMINMINNESNIFLDEVIMNIFESKLMIYFESIENMCKENKNGILFGNAMKIFEQQIQVLDSISLKNEDNDYNLLCKLYSVTYIKMYLDKFVFLIKNKYNEIDEFKDFMKIINEIKNKNFGKVIKIYILKLLYHYLNNNLDFLNDFNFNKYNIDINKDFTSLYNNNKDKNDILITYIFLSVNQNQDNYNYNNYYEKLKLFENIRNSNFQNVDQDFINTNPYLDDDIDTLLTISINNFFCNLNYISKKDEFLKFSSFFNKIFEKKYQNNKELIKLLNLYFDYNTFSKKIIIHLIYDRNFYEILLYGFRYCVQSLENNTNNNNDQCLFRCLLTSEYEKAINQSLIPGNDSPEDLHLITLETIVNHLNTKVDRHGCYVCSCGYYYDIDPCGFPTKNRTFKCPVCEQKIGWGPKVVKKGEETHGMVIRPGHYRIFKDEKQKIGQMKVFDEVDENIPNMLLDNYIKEVIEPIRSKTYFGFNSVLENYFKDKAKKVRNLSKIGYRLLNFISYCHLFFGNLLDVISDDKLNNYLIKNITIIQIIETDWNLLQESLKQKNVSSIEIFMNLIFKELSQLIKECKFLTKEEEREEFEKKVEFLIDKCLKEYQYFSYNYIEENKKILKKIDNYSAETIFSELSYPNEEVYPEKDYPMFKYFILTKYKTRDDFIKHLDASKYPLINQLLNIRAEYKKLKYLPAFNEFINYMIDNYSFNITREEAKEKILCNEKIYESPEFIEKYNKFIISWNEIKDKAIKYKCRPEMSIKDLNSNDKLIYFLNDELELYNGMYMASACQNFIYWQNSFLRSIIGTYRENGILTCYTNNIKNKIRLQDSTPGQIVSIDKRFKNSKYRNLNDVIYWFSHRNIFGFKDKINYSDYNTFIYDYDKIEEELGRIILPGLHLFENEEELNFVTFCFEGFRGKHSQIIANFYSKYPQNDLTNEEKNKIIKYIKEKNNSKSDFKAYYNLLQKLTFYLAEKIIIKDDEKIINILQNYPQYFKLSDNCNDFFKNHINSLTIDKIMNLFFYFEHLCYEDIIKNLQDEYKKEIPSNIKIDIINKIKEYTEDNLNNIKYLGAPVRRFISRYLIGKTDTFEIKEDRDLAFELTREDLWEEKYKENNLFNNIIGQIHCFKLTVSKAYSFYELIGDEDKKSILF